MSNNTHMPDGLPKQLLTLLGSITLNNKVNNWCIYENRNNQTCVTIRFSDCEAIEPVYYRRISENQARRNIDRAARHNINKQNTKLEQSNHEGVTTKKRKILSSPENTRGSDNQKSPESHNPGLIDSPIFPINDDPLYSHNVKVDNKPTKEYASAEIANGGFSHSISEEPCSPNFPITPLANIFSSLENCNNSSILLSTTNHVSPPNLKIDSTSQVEYDIQHISTQVDRSFFQSNQITQCGTKSKSKSTQTKLVKGFEALVQVTPAGSNSPLPPSTEQLSGDFEYLNAPEQGHIIFCPCCNETMTTDHECEPEIDQRDNIDIDKSNASTLNQYITSCSQPTSNSPVQNQPTPDPQSNVYPDWFNPDHYNLELQK